MTDEKFREEVLRLLGLIYQEIRNINGEVAMIRMEVDAPNDVRAIRRAVEDLSERLGT